MTLPQSLRPELLAPAGDRDCMRAAVENGADAVYFGLNCGFNARARATNLATDELSEVMQYLHQRGVKGYVTLNTLAFSDELPGLEALVRIVGGAGVDAVLVQDLGLVSLIRTTCPDLPIHASTQMTLTSAECIRVAEEMGIERVVLARELSLREIAQIRHSTSVSLECFVHGALCVAYSGQCLTSESLGGRSANRGQCAQACRLPYDLICDGQDVDLGAQKYLLSPQDLAVYELTPDLIAAGVSCFKIEGRLKTADYVANITSHYRRAIDQVMQGQLVEFSRDDVREMELSFSRGFSPGWLLGDDHKMLVPGLTSAKRGVLLGSITRIHNESVLVRLEGPVSRGDGIVFEGDREAGTEQGGRIFGVLRNARRLEETVSEGVVELEFQHGVIDFERLHVGQSVWKTDDPKLSARLRKTYSSPDPLRKRPLRLLVQAVAGQNLTIAGVVDADKAAIHASVSSNEPLQVARKHPITIEFLREQLSRLGNTAYELESLEAEIVGGPMVPLSVLSKLRQELIARLDHRGMDPKPRQFFAGSALQELTRAIPQRWVGPSIGVVNEKRRNPLIPTLSPQGRGEGARVEQRAYDIPILNPSSDADENRSSDADENPRMHLLCRMLDQVRTVVDEADSSLVGDDSRVYADFQDIREYREAVQIAHTANRAIYLAPPRIQKPDEVGLFVAMLKFEGDGMLVRNLAGMRFCAERGHPFVADYSMNATNELTVQYLIQQGSQRVTASYDLNRDQLLQLVAAIPADWLEVVVHQHMPMFHMEHCVFCAVLSPGTNKTNCGRPCDVHLVQLRDRVGSEHSLKADVGCRNTLYNAVPQSAAEVIPTLIEQGVRDLRIEFLDEQPDDVKRILALYRDLFANRIKGDEVWRRLKAANRVGVTRGTLEERRNPLAIL